MDTLWATGMLSRVPSSTEGSLSGDVPLLFGICTVAAAIYREHMQKF